MHHVDACAAAKLVVCSACVASWQDAKMTQYYLALEFMLGNSRTKLPVQCMLGRRGQFEGVADWCQCCPCGLDPFIHACSMQNNVRTVRNICIVMKMIGMYRVSAGHHSSGSGHFSCDNICGHIFIFGCRFQQNCSACCLSRTRVMKN